MNLIDILLNPPAERRVNSLGEVATLHTPPLEVLKPALPDYALVVHLDQSNRVTGDNILRPDAKWHEHVFLSLISPGKYDTYAFARPDSVRELVDGKLQPKYHAHEDGSTSAIRELFRVTEGVVCREDYRHSDTDIIFERTPYQYERAVQRVERFEKDGWKYQALGWHPDAKNCVSFVLDVMGAAGINHMLPWRLTPWPFLFRMATHADAVLFSPERPDGGRILTPREKKQLFNHHLALA